MIDNIKNNSMNEIPKLTSDDNPVNVLHVTTLRVSGVFRDLLREGLMVKCVKDPVVGDGESPTIAVYYWYSERMLAEVRRGVRR